MAVPDQSGIPLSDEDYSSFGRKLESAVASGDRPTVDQLLRMKEITQRANRELNLKLNAAEQVRLRAIEERTYLGGMVINTVKNGGSYSFVHVHIVGSQKRALMRLLSGDDGLTYHDILLTRYPDGHIGTDDLYDFSKGEMMSRLNKHATLVSLVDIHPELRSQMTADDLLYNKHMDVSPVIMRDVLAGRYKDALTTFRTLPAEVQKLKTYHLEGLRAAQGTGEEEYLAEMERFIRKQPDDDAALLLAIFYSLIKKQCDNALKAIDRVDKKVGGDPYLLVLRSEALLDAGRYAEARTAAENAIKESPKLLQAYWARVTVALKEKNHADTLVWLKRAIESSGATPDAANMENDQTYAEFVKTPQFQELKRWLAEGRK